MTEHARAAALPLRLERTSPVPLYHQLVEQLVAAIDQGVLKPGDLIEREDLLAARLDISRPTLRRALGDLADRGLLVRTRGVGTVVSPTPPTTPPLPSGPKRSGPHHRAWTRVLRLEPDHLDPGVAGELGRSERSRLVYLEQLLVLDGRVVGVRRTWLPTDVIDPLHQDLAGAPPRRILREAGHPVASERRTFGMRVADAVERAALGLRDDGPVVSVLGIAFDEAGTAIERTTHSYRPEFEQYDALLAAG